MILPSACSAVIMKKVKKLKAMARLRMAKIKTRRSVKMLVLTLMPIKSHKTVKRSR